MHKDENWRKQVSKTMDIDFTQVSKEKIITIYDKRNQKPRKILDYRNTI